MRSTRARWRSGVLASLFCVVCIRAQAADRFYVYDLTTSTTFTGIYLAPAGSERWGANQALNDKDHALDPTERLAITGIERGMFDVRLVARGGRTCVKRGVDLTHETTFDIRDGDLNGCATASDDKGNKRP